MHFFVEYFLNLMLVEIAFLQLKKSLLNFFNVLSGCVVYFTKKAFMCQKVLLCLYLKLKINMCCIVTLIVTPKNIKLLLL